MSMLLHCCMSVCQKHAACSLKVTRLLAGTDVSSGCIETQPLNTTHSPENGPSVLHAIKGAGLQAMDSLCSLPRRVELHNMGDSREVQPSCCHIGAHEHAPFAPPEVHKGLGPDILQA